MSWVSIFEGLPKISEWILIIDSDGCYDVAYLSEIKDVPIEEMSVENIKQLCFVTRSSYIDEVTHWMPLPAMPDTPNKNPPSGEQ